MTSITAPRLALALVAVGAAALPSAAQAAPVSVTSATLNWSQVAIYSGAGNVDRTWLGYVTGPSPAQANGTVSPIAPATGDTVTNASPRGATYTQSLPATSGTYDLADGVGTFQLDGGVDFAGTGHGFDITVEKPKVVLNGLTGALYAEGKGSGASATYDASQPLFTLDLSNAEVKHRADGSRLISGIVPALATMNTAFPGNYAVGAGPERTPNTFGSFSLTLRLPGGDQGPKGDTGATGAAGANGKDGASATIRTVKAVLAKAPYTGSATRKVTVYSTKNKKLATGTLKGRVLKVTLADKVTSLSGKVKVKVSGAKTSKTVSIPS